jgi:acetyl esterase/lipase
MARVLCGIVLVLWSVGDSSAQKIKAVSSSVRRVNDVEFARVGEKILRLDLYLPAKTTISQNGLIVWVHGGAWRAGSRKKIPMVQLVHRGYAIASVDYRLSPEAKFPAQIHDIKAAIRFLRAQKDKYGLHTDRIVVAGSSAGGHLAALVGVTNGHEELEGKVGSHLKQSSDVHAIVDFYGPTNFHTILKQSTRHGLSVRVPALKLLLGDDPKVKKSLTTLASPVAHVDKNDPPLLLIHGDQDPQVPINQSHELHAKYKDMERPVRFEVVHGGVHGGRGFFGANHIDLIVGFLAKHLKK